MELLNTFDSARKALAELKLNQKFKRQNKERRQAVELLEAMGKCRGKLEMCKNSFERSIRKQSAAVREGRREGIDTQLQEQTLYDAALGYLLVRDAMFALKSINTYDSVEHAYSMLDEAIRAMSGKTKPKDGLFLGKQHERDSYGFISSNEALRQKGEILDTFFDELKGSGDIEKCIQNYNGGRGIRSDDAEDDVWDRLDSQLGSENGDDPVKIDEKSLFGMDSLGRM